MATNAYQNYQNFQNMLGYPQPTQTPIQSWTQGGLSPTQQYSQQPPKPQVLGTQTVNTPSQPVVNQTNNAQLSLRQQMEQGKIPWDDNALAKANGSGSPGMPDIQSQIDAIYNPSFEYLNQAESNLNSQYPNVLKDIQGQYDVNAKTLEDQNVSGLQKLDTSALGATNRKDDALSAARRLYDELRRGYSQRFGGSTSAGQAASELSAVEQQRQQGQTNRSYADTMAQIEYQRSDLNKAYSTSQMQLKYQTDQARNQAQSDFQTKLLSIQQSKSQIQSAKAQSSLDALQSYRNQLYQINQQNLQFQQTLDAQKNAAAIQLDTYAKQLQLSGTGSKTALDNYYNTTTLTPGSNLSMGANGTTNQPTYTGQIAGTKKTDRYGNVYYE